MSYDIATWLGLGLRWLHLTAGVAWIGASFYFVWLDNNLTEPDPPREGVKGELWAVHGGGFYHSQKYLNAPPQMPGHLHWFKWEAYTTWLSGFFLLCILYYVGADAYLIDRSVADISRGTAIAIGLGSMAGGWIIYDLLCRSPLAASERGLAIALAVLVAGAAWGLCQVFSGRGAFTQIGALIGTIMVANVFVIIIPYQKKTVAALIAAKDPDPYWGAIGKQRSVHNNYLTLPVIFLMLSNHYPLFFATKYNWLIVAIVLLIGPVIRHFFNSQHAGKGNPWWTWGVAAAGMIAIALLSAAGPRAAKTGALPATPAFAEVQNIVAGRCGMCHASEPFWPGIAAAPNGVKFDDAAEIKRHARMIAVNAVMSSAMPPGNVSEISPEERQVLAAWIAAGAPDK